MLCTGVLKNTVSRYVHHGSTVFSCFLDASKAFDLNVSHDILFKHLIEHNLPSALTRLLLSWYKDQRIQVRWNQNLVPVSNDVCQGGVSSPILFTIYIDDLLAALERLAWCWLLLEISLYRCSLLCRWLDFTCSFFGTSLDVMGVWGFRCILVWSLIPQRLNPFALDGESLLFVDIILYFAVLFFVSCTPLCILVMYWGMICLILLVNIEI